MNLKRYIELEENKLTKKYNTMITIEVIRDNFSPLPIIRLPRPCGCCYIYFDGDIAVDDLDAKILIQKLRRVEEIIVEKHHDDYFHSGNIYIDLPRFSIRRMSPEEIYEDWRSKNYEL